MNNQLNNDQDGKRPDNKDPRQGSGKNHQSILAFLICLLVTLVCFALFTNMLKDNSSEISYDKFIDMVDKDQVKEVTIQSSTLTIVPKKKNSKYEDMSYYTTKTEDSTALTKRLEGKGIKFETDPPDVFGEFVAMILSVLLPSVLLFVLLMFFMRRMNKGGGIMGMGVGKSKAKAYVQQETGVSFKDVAGQEEAKEFFAQMATRYKGVPNVIYEVFNEPVEDSWEQVKAYSVEIIKTIRAIEPEAVILVGCPHWDQDIHLAADDPITGYNNIMYTVHFYANTHGQWLRDRTDYALGKGLPVFISECAGMEASGDGAVNKEEWQNWLDWMQQRSISWVAWSVSDKNETCSMLLPSASSDGNWADQDMKEWGRIVRDELQKNRII